MQLSRQSLVRMTDDRGDPIRFLKQLLDPLIAVAVLLGACIAFAVPLKASELILGGFAFALVWPGQIPFRRASPDLMRELTLRWAFAVALLALFGLVTGVANTFDSRVLQAWVITTPFVQFVAHRVSPFLIARLGVSKDPVAAIVVGAGPLGRQLAHAIARDPFEDIRIRAFFDDRNPVRLDEGTNLPRPGMAPRALIERPSPNLAGGLPQVAQFVREHHIARIYIALPMASQPRIIALLDALRDTTASIYFAPDIFLHDLIQARIETIGGMPLVAVCESPFHGHAASIKRLSDLAIALIAIILSAPLMLGVAAIIAATSPGPFLFRQRRYGLDGREINVWKFRSMRTLDNGAVVKQAVRDDNRITPIGRWIRKTSIDELPQFFNVLQGSMSVVGPRPHAVAHNELFRSLIKGYMVRHKVKPGITGWAQVNGARGETATVEAMQRRIEFDLEYLRNWSALLDLRIILKTIRLVFNDPNAY
jgi:putative colanic acid biosynthesis UDP-glucose lipid carrier transferase